MTQTDRNAGLVAAAAIKNPCKAATTADITLSGEQTIDGVSCVTGDRVLVKTQDDDTENGIYEVDTGTWSRTKDCNGAYDVYKGTAVFVYSGTAANGWYYCSATGTLTDGAIDFDTDSVTWAASSSILAVISAYAQTLIDDTSAAAARQTLLLDTSGADIASAATIDLDSATGDFVDVTGTVSITAITLSDGVEKTVQFTGSLTLTNGASLVLGGGDIQTAAGDIAVFRGDASGVVRLKQYFRLSRKGSNVASASSINLDQADGDLVNITGTTGITGITLAPGRACTCRFDDAVTLTHSASLVLPGGSDVTTTAGDYAVFRGYSSGVVHMVSYNAADTTVVGALGSVQTFSSSDTWSRPAGVQRVVVEIWGPGGGGGGAVKTAANSGGAGGGGGGGYSKMLIDVSAINTSTVTIGSGGNGGSTSGTAGAAGGSASSWADGTNTLTANAGSGGSGATGSAGGQSNAGGAGGTATGGDVNVSGGVGHPGNSEGTTGNSYATGGPGGASFGTPSQGAPVDGDGNDGITPGGGGSGAAAPAGGSNDRAGGDGADGLCIVWEYY